MATVQLSDVIVPEVYNDYESNRTTEKSALYRTGVIAPNPKMSQDMTSGGRTFNTPFSI